MATLTSTRLRPSLTASCAGLALLTGCAGSGGGHRVPVAESTSYYLAHAQRNYVPPGPPSDPWGPYIVAAAQHFDVPQMWIRQVMRVESGGHEYSGGQLIVSSAGAMGLMQLEPGTYQEMADRYGLGNDPFNPIDNIMAGAAYIHEMYQIYGSPGFLAAYNAGPGRLDSFVNYNRPLPDQTINYVAMIAPNIEGYYPVHRSAADELAMNTEPMGEGTGILPAGFSPDMPRPDQISAPVQIASLAPADPDEAPAPVTVAPAAPPPPVQVASISPVQEQEAVQAAPVQQAAIQAAPMPAPVQAAPVQAAPERMAQATPVYPAYNPDQPTRIGGGSALYNSSPMPMPPPPPARTAPSYARQEAPVRMASALPPPPPAPSHFSLIPAAMADTPPDARIAPGPHGWAIQVGAYDTSSNARAALGMAELSSMASLTKAQPVVMTISSNGRTRFRARFTGLRHDEAVNACTRLSGGPTGCVVLSPDAQS